MVSRDRLRSRRLQHGTHFARCTALDFAVHRNDTLDPLLAEALSAGGIVGEFTGRRNTPMTEVVRRGDEPTAAAGCPGVTGGRAVRARSAAIGTFDPGAEGLTVARSP